MTFKSSKRTCPICERPVNEEKNWYGEDGHLHETTINCKDSYHHYSYQFNYGNWEECFGVTMFYGSYTDEEERIKHVDYMKKVVTVYEQELYRKKVKKANEPISF